MKINYPEVGVCGLSCRLCPAYHAGANRWCDGCKREKRMNVGCPFITCALKKHNIEFCWDCSENQRCERWRKHRTYGKNADSFKCYQTLEADIECIQRNGISEFERNQALRESLLTAMLHEFNEGRSKSYYCIAATVVDVEDLNEALAQARKKAVGLDIKQKAKVLHRILDEIAEKKHYILKLRK